MNVATLPDGARGFDVNCRIGPKTAAAFKAHGYQFAVRYLPRSTGAGVHDLNAGELVTLLSAGLAVMAVQHVESESSWVPSSDKGSANGTAAADAARACGLPLGVCVWLDLEGVDVRVGADEIIAYASAWFTAVASAGYTPSLYVGWHSGLSPAQLFALPFEHYWGAYNLNADEQPATRGVQMQQHAAKHADLFAGCPEIDVNTIHADRLGGTPLLVIP